MPFSLLILILESLFLPILSYMQRFPSQGKIPRTANDESLVGKHQLFDLKTDPEQLRPLEEKEVEAKLIDRMRIHLELAEAPLEQCVSSARCACLP